MMIYLHPFILFFVLVFHTCCSGQNKPELPKENSKSESKEVVTRGPKSIVRTIRQDRKGNIWIASWEGIFRYDGKSFANITSKVSSARFFSVLEDRKGNFWFASVGSGVYYYDGNSFRNYTIKDGLANNVVTAIYEDKAGNIWFGTEGGASRYDGISFKNFSTKDGLPDNRVNWILEDRIGKFWFGTTGYASVYDGKKFTAPANKEGKAFKNVRCITEDRKGNIWLGGDDGLWRYDGNVFTNFTKNFIGYIYEDKHGNIWTSSSRPNKQGWELSRYDEKSLNGNLLIDSPALTYGTNKIASNEGIIFGVLEGNDGSIWFGTLNGVTRYDGDVFSRF